MTTDDTTKLPRTLAAIVPCFNPGDRVAGVVEGLLAVMDRVIVVDDGSTDGSIAPLRERPVEIVSLPVNRGKGHALLAGYRAALEDAAVECVAVVDADGQHDPAQLPRLYEAFQRKSADLLIGARQFDKEGVPWRSRFGNKVTVAVAGIILGAKTPDTQSGYRLASRKFLEETLPRIPGGRYETEMQLLAYAIRGGYEVAWEPIPTIYEPGNASSHFRKFSDSWRIYRTLLASRFR